MEVMNILKGFSKWFEFGSRWFQKHRIFLQLIVVVVTYSVCSNFFLINMAQNFQ